MNVEFAFSNIHELLSGDGIVSPHLHAMHLAAKAEWRRRCFIIELLAPEVNAHES